MDVGESPINESEEYCGAIRIPGTALLCEEPVMMVEGLITGPDGKQVPGMVRVTRMIEGGNKGVGFAVPLCEKHNRMWAKDPSSIEIAIPPSPKK